MSWSKIINHKGLDFIIESSTFADPDRGIVIGFFVNDSPTRKALEDNDSRISEILEWTLSEECRDFCASQQREIETAWQRIDSNNPQGLKNQLTKQKRLEFRKIYTHLRSALIERDGYKCSIDSCQEIEDLTIDHVIPLSKGGTNDLSNLRLLCKHHNSQKGDRDR